MTLHHPTRPPKPRPPPAPRRPPAPPRPPAPRRPSPAVAARHAETVRIRQQLVQEAAQRKADRHATSVRIHQEIAQETAQRKADRHTASVQRQAAIKHDRDLAALQKSQQQQDKDRLARADHEAYLALLQKQKGNDRSGLIALGLIGGGALLLLALALLPEDLIGAAVGASAAGSLTIWDLLVRGIPPDALLGDSARAWQLTVANWQSLLAEGEGMFGETDMGLASSGMSEEEIQSLLAKAEQIFAREDLWRLPRSGLNGIGLPSALAGGRSLLDPRGIVGFFKRGGRTIPIHRGH